MKKILSLLITGLLMLSVVGAVVDYDANGDGKNDVLDKILVRNEAYLENVSGIFLHPDEGQFIRGEVEISWIGDFEAGFLKYAEGSCDNNNNGDFIIPGPINSEGSYLWDTTKLEDGRYCLKLTGNENIYDDVSITIDNTEPEVQLFVINEGNERDKPVEINLSIIEENQASCEIDWGDETTSGCDVTEHQYQDNGKYKIKVLVKDLSGNEGEDYAWAYVENVAPWNVRMNISGELVINNELTFSGFAQDVPADSLLYYWNFGDGREEETTETEITHTYKEEGTYNVIFAAYDGENASERVNQTITIAGLNPGGETKGVINELINLSVETGLESPACSVIDKPENLAVFQDGTHCNIEWIPASNQTGEYNIILKASDGEISEYYSIKITVYLWKIPLKKGWNVFSIPYEQESSDINDVLGGIIESVHYDSSEYSIFYYDAVEDKWYKARPYKDRSGYYGHSSSRIKSIVPGYGYWINMDKADTIYGMKKDISPTELPTPEITLKTSAWNLIGKYGIGSAPIKTALESLEDYYFNENVLGFINGEWKPVTMMDMGEGYWIRIKIVPCYDTIDYFPLGELI